VSGYSLNLMLANKAADGKHIGVALGRICIKTGLPVSVVAQRFGVSRQTVYNWFEGLTTPTNQSIEPIKQLIATLKHKYNNV
jgi:DNA-binding transcriptional regulator YiaG